MRIRSYWGATMDYYRVRSLALGVTMFIGTTLSAHAACGNADRIATEEDLQWSIYKDKNTKECVRNAILNKAHGSVYAVSECNTNMNQERYDRCDKEACSWLEKQNPPWTPCVRR